MTFSSNLWLTVAVISVTLKCQAKLWVFHLYLPSGLFVGKRHIYLYLLDALRYLQIVDRKRRQRDRREWRHSVLRFSDRYICVLEKNNLVERTTHAPCKACIRLQDSRQPCLLIIHPDSAQSVQNACFRKVSSHTTSSFASAWHWKSMSGSLRVINIEIMPF